MKGANVVSLLWRRLFAFDLFVSKFQSRFGSFLYFDLWKKCNIRVSIKYLNKMR